MKTHPIIFSTPMVQAILEGRKTMTRRVVKPQPYLDERYNLHTWDGPRPKAKRYTGSIASSHLDGLFESLSFHGKYQPGDVLWVRETFSETQVQDEEGWFYVFKADGDDWAAPWKPSIHMPKSAARIFLEVTSIRVERLLSISFEDAKKEGILGLNCCERYFDYVSKDYTKPNALASFSSLWVSIHGTESWNSNPWVWVIQFKCIDKPENF